MVIYNHTIADNGIFQRPAINSRTGADLNIITDINRANLMNLLVAPIAVWRKAKAICTNYGTTVNANMITYNNIVIEGYIGGNMAVLT